MTEDAIDPAQADLLARLDAACPGFVPYPSSEGLAYMLIGDFVRHVIAAHLAGRHAEVQAAFDVIEATLSFEAQQQRKSPVGELAVVGFLEDMQNGNLHRDGSRPGDFRRYLGPHSLKSWEALNGFWQAVEHHKS